MRRMTRVTWRGVRPHALAVALVLGGGWVSPWPRVLAQGDPVQERREALPQGEPPREEAPRSEKLFELEEVTVLATRNPRLLFETPRSVNLVGKDRIGEIQPQVALDALKYDVGVFVEKRTTTTGDPIIRGFAGRNILALVDGNTLTTLWGEGGDGADDMYGKIDPDTIERIEVIRGPASVLYGTNAVGGVINFVTRKPALDFTEEGLDFRFRLKATYASASNLQRFRAEVHAATPTFRIMVGGTSFTEDDVEGGRGLGTLDPSDASGRFWDVSAEFIPYGPEHLFGLTIQSTDLDNTKRFYRPHQDNFNDRDAVGLLYRNTADNAIWEELEARFYWQYKEDRRRWLQGDEDAGQRGVAKTKTISTDLQVTSLPEIPVGRAHRVTYGIHGEWTDGESPDDEQFTITRPDLEHKVKAAPDSLWQNLGAFLQDEWDVTERLDVIASLRYDWFRFDSNVDAFYEPPLPEQDPKLDELTEKRGVVSGGVGVLYHLHETTNLFANYARGFRQNAPNFGVRLLSDIGYLVPNPMLDPIKADQYEAGVKVQTEGFRGYAAGYYTLISDQQTISEGTFNGLPFWDANGNGERDEGELPILETVAGGKATLKGLESQAELRLDRLAEWIGRPDLLGPEWSMRGGFAWEIGRDRNIDGPMRWIHPAYGVASLRYTAPSEDVPFWVELAGTFARRFDRVPKDREGSPEWRSDPQDRDSGPLRDYVGVPGYTVLDLRGGVDLSDSARLTLAVENLTDRRYRSAHSRMDAPGINFVASIDLWF